VTYARELGTLLSQSAFTRVRCELIAMPLQAFQRKLHLLENPHSERGINRRLRRQFRAETFDAAPIFVDETIGMFEQTQRHGQPLSY
jgi:hypothetical protein